MKVTVSAPEPRILREAQTGDLFLMHVPGYEECIFTLLVWQPPQHKHRTRVVCLGCRVGKDDSGYLDIGVALEVHSDSPITLLDQVEPAAYRGRPHPQPQAASAAARNADSSAGQPKAAAEKGMAEHLHRSTFLRMQSFYATPSDPRSWTWPDYLSRL